MKTKVPIHVGIIPDGNRRWARARGMKGYEGHNRAADFSRFQSFIKEGKKLGLKYISLWGFSTENWKRSKKEKENLFEIFERLFNYLLEISAKENLRVRHFGRRDRLPMKLVKKIEEVEKKTKKNKSFGFNVCLDYGGRDELVRAINKILNSGKKKISEKDFEKNLDSAGIPDLDLIIRTSGEQRLSGFMPFQGTYAELYFVKKHFPSFTAKDLRKAVESFGKRDRRFGGDSE